MVASTESWEKEHKTSKLVKKGVTEQGSVALRLSGRLAGLRFAIHGGRWGSGNDLCVGPELLKLTKSLTDPMIAALSPLLREKNARRQLKIDHRTRVDSSDWTARDYATTGMRTPEVKDRFPLTYAGVRSWFEEQYPDTLDDLSGATWSQPRVVRKLHGTSWISVHQGDDVAVMWQGADRAKPPTLEYAHVEEFAEVVVLGRTYLALLPIWYHGLPGPSTRGLKLVRRELAQAEAYTAVDIAALETQIWVRHNCTWGTRASGGCYVGQEGRKPVMVHSQIMEWEIVDADAGYRPERNTV